MVLERGIRPVLRKSIRMGVRSIFKALILALKYVLYRHLNIEYYDYKAVFDTKKNIFPYYDQVWDFHGYNSLTTYLAAHKFQASTKSMWLHNEDISKEAANYPKTQQCFNNIFAVSEDCAKIYNSYFGSGKAQVFYNLIDKKVIIENSERFFPFKNDDGKIILTTVGRLSFLKGYDMALQSAKILKEKGFIFRWYFVGGGEDELMLKSLCEAYDLNDYIVFVGFTDNPYPYIKACTIYVQPSRREGYAVTLMEAKVLKKVIVTTKVSGSNEAVINGFNGKIVNPNPLDIAEGILYICQTDSVLFTMTENAKNDTNGLNNSNQVLRKLLYY